MAPTTPGKNAMEADERAKQRARLVAKNPASPKKVTSLAQTTSQPRSGGHPRPEDQPTSPEEPSNLVQAANCATANGEHGPGSTGPEGGNSLKKTARSLKNAALRGAKATCGRVFG